VEWLQILVLALVQGLTEFLPISSSAHLILSPYLFGFPDQGLAFDVAVHVGSLGAVTAYFWPELLRIAQAMLGQAAGRPATTEARLGWLIILATVPVVIAGLLLKGLVETEFRSPLLIAGTTIAFGLALLWADLTGRRQRDEHSLSLRDALVIGLMQAVALVPGTSRSGITMTAGLLLGLTREAAARFSFLLSIPTILMSGGLVTLELITSETYVDWLDLFLALCLSFLAAYACIALFLKVIERIGMLPFVVYRLVLGVVIVAIVL
jgi:undecaprenyl-diphosphatase